MATDTNTQNNTETKTASGRVFRGTVVSAKAKDTITVAVERYVKHPKYKKFLRRTKKYLVHDAGNTCAEGDVVSIQEVKPISKRKHFVVASRDVVAEAAQA
jgi:small subunit ribosomal protein S17